MVSPPLSFEEKVLHDLRGLTGRAFGVVPREESPSGHMDLVHDDYQEGDFLREWEDIVLDTAQSIVDLA